jgi:hypothetical protein
MTEMRKATWSGLDGRAVLRRDRKPRAAEPAKVVEEVKDEGVSKGTPPSPIAIDPPGD